MLEPSSGSTPARQRRSVIRANVEAFVAPLAISFEPGFREPSSGSLERGSDVAAVFGRFRSFDHRVSIEISRDGLRFALVR